MSERPILFSGPMVRALLDGSKTQTRRIVKYPARWAHDCAMRDVMDGKSNASPWPHCLGGNGRYNKLPCPYGQPGDRLWVKETFMPRYGGTLPTGKGFTNVRYRADDDARDCFGVDHKGQVAVSYGPDKWRPSIFCTRWASRITLEITAVRVERLQDITEEDAKAEGMNQATAEAVMCPDELATFAAAHILAPEAMARITFETVWEKINGPGSWDANPFVWVVKFKRLPQP